MEAELINTQEGLEGELGYKGERGYSAYEIAVKNGYEGTEQDWIDHFGLDLTDYIKDTDIVDNCESTTTTKPLSANQGKRLMDWVTSLYTNKADKDDNPYFDIVSGSAEIEKGSTESTFTVDIPLPLGYTTENTFILSTMIWAQYELLGTPFNSYNLYRVIECFIGSDGQGNEYIRTTGKWNTVVGDDYVKVRVAITKTDISPWDYD